jgi:RNA polymerase sigma-70 factor (ECF subfamily)
MIVEQIMPLEAAAVAAAAGEDARETFCMDERSFREFYAGTAGKLRGYLLKVSGNPALTDDLLQESYFRLLRADFQPESEDHRKNYLFRIASNLLRDHFRRSKRQTIELPESLPSEERLGEKVGLRKDVTHLLTKLNPRERELLWLAYVEGSSHKEIAEVTGLKTASIRPLLFRARRKMAELLRAQGYRPGASSTRVTP